MVGYSVRSAVKRKIHFNRITINVREEESKLLLGEDMLRYCILLVKATRAVGRVPQQDNRISSMVEQSP